MSYSIQDLVAAIEEKDQFYEFDENYLCPISLEIMTDPVMAADGIIYDRKSIEAHFIKTDEINHERAERNLTPYALISPMTGLDLNDRTLVPQHERVIAYLITVAEKLDINLQGESSSSSQKTPEHLHEESNSSPQEILEYSDEGSSSYFARESSQATIEQIEDTQPILVDEYPSQMVIQTRSILFRYGLLSEKLTEHFSSQPQLAEQFAVANREFENLSEFILNTNWVDQNSLDSLINSMSMISLLLEENKNEQLSLLVNTVLKDLNALSIDSDSDAEMNTVLQTEENNNLASASTSSYRESRPLPRISNQRFLSTARVEEGKGKQPATTPISSYSATTAHVQESKGKEPATTPISSYGATTTRTQAAISSASSSASSSRPTPTVLQTAPDILYRYRQYRMGLAKLILERSRLKENDLNYIKKREIYEKMIAQQNSSIALIENRFPNIQEYCQSNPSNPVCTRSIQNSFTIPKEVLEKYISLQQRIEKLRSDSNKTKKSNESEIAPLDSERRKIANNPKYFNLRYYAELNKLGSNHKNPSESFFAAPSRFLGSLFGKNNTSSTQQRPRLFSDVGSSSRRPAPQRSEEQQEMFGFMDTPLQLTSEKQNADSEMVKVQLVGDSAVGKSCLLLRMVDGTYTDNFIARIGVDYKIKSVNIGDAKVRLQIWDPTGQHRFHNVDAYYKSIDIIMLCFDVTDRESLYHAQREREALLGYSSKSYITVLIGNKCDGDPRQRQVTYAEARALAYELGIEHYFETSAKENINIEDTARALAYIHAQTLVKEPQKAIVIDGSNNKLQFKKR